MITFHFALLFDFPKSFYNLRLKAYTQILCTFLIWGEVGDFSKSQ